MSSTRIFPDNNTKKSSKTSNTRKAVSIVAESVVVLPKVTDAQIDKFYKSMLEIDPDQAKFKGSKREYVLDVYTSMNVFMDMQHAFSMKG